MPVTHINRKGKTYYLHEGVTSKGNPKFFFSTKSEGRLAVRVPEGFEIYENPNAQASPGLRGLRGRGNHCLP